MQNLIIQIIFHTCSHHGAGAVDGAELAGGVAHPHERVAHGDWRVAGQCGAPLSVGDELWGNRSICHLSICT